MKQFIKNLEIFLETLDEIIKQFIIIIIVDFNINVLDYDNSKTTQFKDLLSTFNFELFINISPSKISFTSSIIIVNVIYNMQNISVHNAITSRSDHYAQAVCIQDWFPKPHSHLNNFR